MPDRASVAYFGAGPSALPTSVLETAAASLVNHNGSGLSLVEQSHRSALSGQILQNAKDSFLKIINATADTHTVLFMAGGGTLQFSAVVYNLFTAWALRNPERAQNGERGACEYLITGGWSSKAADEAKRLIGEENVNVVLDSRGYHHAGEAKKFGNIPDSGEWKGNLKAGKDSAFVYFCDNETVDGVEFPKGSPVDVLGEDPDRIIVADMSSNILSRTFDASKFGVVFAGAQKNVGSTGVTIVLLRNDILSLLASGGSLPPKLTPLIPVTPVMMHYPTISKAGSLYNTLPIFDVYIAGLTLTKLLQRDESGKTALEQQEAESDLKAKLLYDVLDKYENIYRVVPAKNVRSRMNICFRISAPGDEAKFIKGGEEIGLLGLKGHRSVGGIRISNYNAVGVDSVKKLVQYLEEYAKAVLRNSGARAKL
ncbi:Phosphoserine transaminase [Orbilia oligospora]|uniref:phosphoserine transaminase n=1 Tax=Orbilia oligospora TaxID=2813651 RepID=A0A7C8QZV2_ORBOL|nr:Phosphoserine transaminase [Orbilia oligospora]